MTDTEKIRLSLRVMALLLGGAALVLAWTVDWRISAAIMLAIWGNNIHASLNASRGAP